MRESLGPRLAHIVVVGGGRWGLEICSALDQVSGPDVAVWLLSRHLSADCLPGRARRVSELAELPIPGATGAAIIATAPHDHAETAERFLAAGWHVLIEKPAALTLSCAKAVSEHAGRMQRQAWVGLVYFFAPYIPVMRPYVRGETRWLLQWFEPDEEVRRGAFKSTQHHVNAIEDIFPHAWSILRAAGLAAPLELKRVDVVNPWSVRLQLAASKAEVEILFDRHAGFRRRCLQLEADGHKYELDFSEEPGTFKIDGAIAGDLPWDPAMRPLARELSAFLAACSGAAAPAMPVSVSHSLEAVALMEAATTAFLKLQARLVAGALPGGSSQPGAARVLFEAVSREAAMAGIRLKRNSAEEQAVKAAAQAFLGGRDDAFAEIPSEIGTIARRSPFLAQVRQERAMVDASR